MMGICPDVRRDVRPDKGLPNESSESAVIGVGGVDSRSRSRDGARGAVDVCGEMPRSK
jgi:hypothetical protein